MQLEHEGTRPLDYEQMGKFLSNHTLGHLGCRWRDEVYVVPVNFVYEDGVIYCYSMEGKKVEMMRRYPKVCLQVEEVIDTFHWKSVIVWGEFKELHGPEAAKAIRLLNRSLLNYQQVSKTSDLTVEFERLFNKAVIYKISIDRATGRMEDGPHTSMS